MGKRILTGIQPSGILHIGNYFGAMRSALELQEQNPGNTFLFIADLHSLTVNPDPADLRMRVQRLALDFLACGLDPEKTAFFRQSDINGICELTWILNTITSAFLQSRPLAFLCNAAVHGNTQQYNCSAQNHRKSRSFAEYEQSPDGGKHRFQQFGSGNECRRQILQAPAEHAVTGQRAEHCHTQRCGKVEAAIAEYRRSTCQREDENRHPRKEVDKKCIDGGGE